MEERDLVNTLKLLAQLYADAAWTYERAIDKIDQDEMRDELLDLRDQHLRHYENLSNYLRDIGEMPPRYGYPAEISEGLRSITDEMSVDETIRALKNNERYITTKIREAEETTQLAELTDELEGELEDEQSYIKILDDMAS